MCDYIQLIKTREVFYKFLSLLSLKWKYFTENIAFNGMRGILVFPISTHIHEHKLSIIGMRYDCNINSTPAPLSLNKYKH